ncbi:MAG: Rieske (2Fe-2S) protein [Planctomycetota bacterium]|nr:Rieske (2Fe-2S) protein [Planctomycetota bacterium]MDA1137403.1 Rieske (2Fe-2S) protein [Planctomycetota bacterium]
MEYVKVAKIGEIPGDRGLAVRVGERPVALFKVGEEVFALKDVCPHLGASMSRGFILENKVVACADHGWTFRMEDGISPDIPDCSLPCYNVKVEGDDIYVSTSYREPGSTIQAKPGSGTER